jgi:foldase protein PrsA
LAFCAAIATAVVVGACGSGVPGGAIAVIGSAPITKAALDHWMVVANDSTQASTGAAAPPLPVPPDYTACVAKGQTTGSSASAAKTLCAQQYQSLLTEVESFLIQAIWIQGEAVDRGVKVTNAQVETSYNTQRKASKPALTTAAELNTFLAKSGQTISDLKWRTYLNLLANKITLKVQNAAAVVTNNQIAAYYKKNYAQFVVPPTRDLHLVESKTAADAAKVKALLAGGSSYAVVAPKYSIDVTTKAAGGQMTGVSAGELNSQFSAAAFAAKTGVLSGPIKTPFGYYVFTVDSAKPASVQSLTQAHATIRADVAQQHQAAANALLQSDFTKKWTGLTKCASGFIVSSCSNAPKTSSTAATGVTTPAG